MTGWREQLEQDGFSLLTGVLTAEQVATALAEWGEAQAQNVRDPAILANDGPAYGARNVLQLWPRVTELVRAPKLLHALRDVLGDAAGIVRVLFFDKPPGHSWALPWHKDYNIAVREHRGDAVFTRPTTKAGVPHVMAPATVLDRMLTARIHLDDVTADNGPLRVIPGSHRHYAMGEDAPREPVAVHCHAGDVLLMRPLVTHASGNTRPDAGMHRRIVHVECAAMPELSDGYYWHDFRPLIDEGQTC